MQGYLRYIQAEATQRHAAGMTAGKAAHDMDLGAYHDSSDPERIAVSIETIYRELDPTRPVVLIVELMERMARWLRHR